MEFSQDNRNRLSARGYESRRSSVSEVADALMIDQPRRSASRSLRIQPQTLNVRKLSGNTLSVGVPRSRSALSVQSNTYSISESIYPDEVTIVKKAEPLFSPYCIGITLFVLICGGCFVPIHIFILNSETEGLNLNLCRLELIGNKVVER